MPRERESTWPAINSDREEGEGRGDCDSEREKMVKYEIYYI